MHDGTLQYADERALDAGIGRGAGADCTIAGIGGATGAEGATLLIIFSG